MSLYVGTKICHSAIFAPRFIRDQNACAKWVQAFLRESIPLYAIMIANPIRLETDGLGCPDCKYALGSVKSPFYLHDKYVGHFDSLSCSICSYHLFTSKGYELAIKTANRFGLINSKIEREFEDLSKIEREFEDLSEEHFTQYCSLANSNRGFNFLSHENDGPVSGYNKPEELVVSKRSSPQKMKTQKTYY